MIHDSWRAHGVGIVGSGPPHSRPRLNRRGLWGARVTASLFAPHAARVRHAWLGGKDSFAVDENAAEAVREIAQCLPQAVRAGRWFAHREVRDAVASGICQILDVGTGFPLAPSLYDVARLADVDVRVAYVADDPISAARARMLLHLAGRTTVFERPLRASEVLHVAESFFDLERPVVVVLDAVLDHFPAESAGAEEPAEFVSGLHKALAPGSRLIVTHVTSDPGLLRDRHRSVVGALDLYNACVHPEVTPRSPAELELLLESWELVEQGVAALGLSGRAVAWDNDEPLPVLGAVAAVPTGRTGGKR